MNRNSPHPILLATALGLLLAGTAAAQSPAPAPAPKARSAANTELAAAQAELERAARRVAELSRQHGHDARVHVAKRVAARKPVIGVLLAPDARAGVRIAGVTPDSAAAKAGLMSGDVLLSVDGKQLLGSSGELRVENARKLLGGLDSGTPVKLGYRRAGRDAVVSVTPTLGEGMRFWAGPDGMAFTGLHDPLPPGVAPKIHREVIRLGADGKCKGAGCRLPMLAEAFRWNGLNLASVDPQLGRYFGTDRGVLVLSTGQDFGDLQPGDVVRKVDGKPVGTPREAMAAMHAKPAGSSVTVEYLRDRKGATTQVKVPSAMPLRAPLPPAPPAPPAPPRPPQALVPVAPSAPLPPAPPVGAFEIELDGDAAAIAYVQLADAPAAGEADTMARRVKVLVDEVR